MAGRLKAEPRRGWVKKLGMGHPESVADHSYRTALITMIFSDSQGLDTAKALRLALLHDLPEAIVGDAMPDERSGGAQDRLRDEGDGGALLSELPEAIRALYRRGLGGVRGWKTEEARLVRQLDKLEMAIQAWEYVQESSDPALAREFWATAREHVSDEALLELLTAGRALTVTGRRTASRTWPPPPRPG